MKANKLKCLVLAPALALSFTAVADQQSRLGAFEYGINSNTQVTEDQTMVQDLEFIGGVLLTEGVKAIIRLEMENQDLSDVQIKEALEEMKLSIALDELTGNPRALVTNVDVGIIEAVFKTNGSENAAEQSNLLFGLSDSDRGVVGMTVEINPEMIAFIDRARVSIYETGAGDGFDISDEKAVAANFQKQVGDFALEFSTRWKETSSEDDDWTNQLALVWDRGEGYRVWGSVLHNNNDGIYDESMAATIGAAYDTTFGTLFAEAEYVPNYANSLTAGLNYRVADGITVSPFVRYVTGDQVEDDTLVGVQVAVAMYRKAERAFLSKKN